jgi:3-sulfinopropanoyl-CoA desulfinase
MGAIGAVMAYGSEKQKRLAARHVLAGDKPAICITEPNAGSAATEMTTQAVKRGDKYIVNGKKHWITGGGVSKIHLVFAQLVEGGVSQGIAGFIAIRDETPGLVAGGRLPAMGLRGIPETELLFTDMEIPVDMNLIPPEGIKRGFAGLMNAYNAQRVGAGTVALGIAQGVYEEALSYVRERQQFGRPIAEFQGLQWMLADMSIGLSAARALLHLAAAAQGMASPTLAPLLKPRSWPRKQRSKLPTMHCKSTVRRGIRVTNRWKEWSVTRACLRSPGIQRRSFARKVASAILNMKTPQTRDGYTKLAEQMAAQ